MERLNLALPYTPTEFAIHSLRYLPLRGAVAGKRVLDIACGEGLGASLISRWGADSVVGVDIAQEAISAAKARLVGQEKARIEFICADAFNYLEGVREGFDIIISAETIEHLNDPRRFLELCRSRLTADGSLVVTCPNDHYYYGGGKTMNQYHRSSYDFDSFKKLTEDVLGAGVWALGAPLNGFGLFPLEVTELASGNYKDALSRRRVLGGEVAAISDQATNGLTPDNSLFYLGVWGPLFLRSAIGVAIPFESDHRLGVLRSVSEDIAHGSVRRMAIVHDDEVRADEIEALRDLLAGKYAIEAVVWTGDVDALASELLSNEVTFDNIHFETPDAFDALAEWVSRSTLSVEFVKGCGANWSTTTLTVRPNAQFPSKHNLTFIDGSFGRTTTARTPRTAAGERAVLWGPRRPDPGNSDIIELDPVYRIAVVMPDHTECDSADSLIEAAGVDADLPKLTVVPVVADMSPQELRKTFTEVDALLCLDSSTAARRGAEEAICCGLAVILPVAHPLAPLLGDSQKPLIMAHLDSAALSHALRAIYLDSNDRTCIRLANLALAEYMSTPARGIAWTRALAQAQLSCEHHGAPLRAAVMRATAQAVRVRSSG